MLIWSPLSQQSYWKNGKLYGEGLIINEINCVFKKSTFDENGRLNGSATVYNYTNATVFIRVGTYADEKENGTISEYVFNRSLWPDLLAGSTITTTKYTHVFSAGIWQSTSNTQSKQISVDIIYNGVGNKIDINLNVI